MICPGLQSSLGSWLLSLPLTAGFSCYPLPYYLESCVFLNFTSYLTSQLNYVVEEITRKPPKIICEQAIVNIPWELPSG